MILHTMSGYIIYIYIYTYIQNIVSLTYIHNVLDQKLFMHVWILCAYILHAWFKVPLAQFSCSKKSIATKQG